MDRPNLLLLYQKGKWMEINVVKLKEYGVKCGVLYVEDDELIRSQTVEFLSRFFTHIDVAINGEEGLSIYNPTLHTLVISDINMPKMNGIEMIGEIRKRYEEQIILVTSAHNDSENLMALINMGVHRFVLKPFNFKQFIIMLYYIVEEVFIRQQNVALQQQAQKIVDMMDNGIVVLHHGKVTMANRAFVKMGGFTSLETLLLEMPEIGVMFQPCTHCLNATTNQELLNGLKNLPESQHKVRIESESNFIEYHVRLSEIEEDKYVLVFSDITAIHDELSSDIHTKLPGRKAILEQMEVMGDMQGVVYVVLITISNFDALQKFYSKADVIGVKKEAAAMLKSTIENAPIIAGYFGDSNFLLLSLKSFDEELMESIESKKVHYVIDHQAYDNNLNFSYKTKQLALNTKKGLESVEAMLISEYELLH